MLSSVAGLRRNAAAALVCLAATSFAGARDEVLFTSSVSYCEPPELVLVQQFDIVYFAANQSIFFNVSAASVESNVNVTANLLVNVYGMKPLNLTIDLCNILNGALCPLPTYNFTGSETLQLPSSIDITSELPSIAYRIPDLEAFAQLTLTSVDTNEVKACIQSTLANGWSTRQTAVQWSTGALAILAFASALLHSFLCSPESRAPFRFMDLFGVFQTIAASSLLGLNYPVVYRMFTSNFSWALGLFYADSNSNIQNAINNMRHLTGGSMDDASGGSGVELVNRKLSPYNDIVNTAILPAVQDLQSRISTKALLGITGAVAKRDEGTVTVTSSNVLQAGIPVWVNSLGISTANAFMTVFITLLILIAIVVGVLSIGWAVLNVVLRWREKKRIDAGRLEEWREYYPWFAKAWVLRTTLVVFFPVAIFAFHQWTLKDSWLATFLSVLTFLAVLAALAYPTYTTNRLARRERPWILYRDTPHLMSSGPLYIQYRHQRWFFFLVSLAAIFARAIVVAFGGASGLVQLIVLLIIEITVLGLTLVLRPHETRGGDVLATTLAIVRVLATGLSFAFVESFNVSAIPRVVIGFVILVVFSFTVILMFINTLVNLGLRTLWRDHLAARLGTRLGSSLHVSGSGKGSLMDEKSGRPRNPTPHHNIPLDPAVIEAYPSVTPAASTTFSPSAYTTSAPSSAACTQETYTSASTTLGSVLPRRPSFEGLGLDNLVPREAELEEDGVPSHENHSPAMTHFSSSSSSYTPSTPHSTSGSRRGSQRQSWAMPTTLPRMSEDVESPGALETVNDRGQEERPRLPPT
ncbi:hypothetical protein M0805_000520 [Coniferiporia weirii]|nr:hypothetical protein M0805_000520 [Coniferiporia weirii]